MKSCFLKSLLVGTVAAFALAIASIAPQEAHAAASTQAAHAYLCAPVQTAGGQARHVVNTSSTASPQPSYNLNSAGCAVIASGDIGFFLSQGYYYGPNIFSLVQTGITATTTSSTSTITLPAGAIIQNIVLAETAGHPITGGVDIGDSTSATEYASAVALGTNGTVVVADSALTRVFANSGTPANDQILIACHTACNSGSINVTILYSFF